MNSQNNTGISLVQRSKTSNLRINSALLFKLGTKVIVLVLTLLTTNVQAFPFITISGTAPDEATAQINGVDPGVQATDFCVLAVGEFNDTEDDAFNFSADNIDDYNLSPFRSSQSITSASIGSQHEAFGGGEGSSLNEGLCFDFPSDPLDHGEPFSVTVELTFSHLNEFSPATEQSGFDLASCLFSYHNEDPDPFEPDEVIYISGGQGNCSETLGAFAATPIRTKIVDTGLAGPGNPVNRVTFEAVEEPLTLALMLFSVLLFKRRTKAASGNRFNECRTMNSKINI